DADPADAYFADSMDRETVLLTRGLKSLEISSAAGAETEIASDTDFRDFQRAHEKLGDKFVSSPSREFMRERNDQQRVDAHVRKQFFFLRQREDLFRNAIGRDDRQRMRVERDDRRRPVQLPRAFDDAADDLLMPDVQTIEVAYRCDASARQVR